MDISPKKRPKKGLRMVFPIVFGLIAILEYLFFPNYDKNAVASPVYLYFLIFLLQYLDRQLLVKFLDDIFYIILDTSYHLMLYNYTIFTC